MNFVGEKTYSTPVHLSLPSMRLGLVSAGYALKRNMPISPMNIVLNTVSATAPCFLCSTRKDKPTCKNSTKPTSNTDFLSDCLANAFYLDSLCPFRPRRKRLAFSQQIISPGNSIMLVWTFELSPLKYTCQQY